MSEPTTRNRYRGLGGIYVVVDGETYPADEAGNPLPHTLDEQGAPLAAELVPATPADVDPQE